MGEKYRHLVHDAGCGCSHPDLQRASRRLEAFSRRDLLSGLAATALVGALPAQGLGQTAAKPNKTLLSNARLFDSKAGTVVDNVQVLISDNQIADVDRSHAPPPDGATVLDCRNGVIMPGLIDGYATQVWLDSSKYFMVNLVARRSDASLDATACAYARSTRRRPASTRARSPWS